MKTAMQAAREVADNIETWSLPVAALIRRAVTATYTPFGTIRLKVNMSDAEWRIIEKASKSEDYADRFAARDLPAISFMRN